MPTIGVSIAVPDPWGRRLQEYRVALGDESAELIPTHVTLLPPSEVTDSELATLDAHLEDVAARTDAFGLHLRGTGTFRPVSRVVFVNVVAGISQSEQLATDVRRGPLVVSTRFPYHPHVTVAHDLSDELLDRAFAELADLEAAFEVDRFFLYEHHPESGWQATRRYLLTQ